MDRNTHTTQMEHLTSLDNQDHDSGLSRFLLTTSAHEMNIEGENSSQQIGGGSVNGHHDTVLSNDPPPSYSDSVKRKRDSDVQRGRPNLKIFLPLQLKEGKIPPRFQYDHGKETTQPPFELPETHWCHRLQEIAEYYTRHSTMPASMANTANLMLTPELQQAIKEFINTYRPELRDLAELRGDSMLYILHNTLNHPGDSEEVISELISRIFGMMCFCWELVSSNDLHRTNQIEQDRVIEELKNMSHNITMALEAQKIPDTVRILTETLAIQVSELTKVNSSVVKMCESNEKISKELDLLKAQRESDLEIVITSQKQVIDLQSKLTSSEREAVASKGCAKQMYLEKNALQKENDILREEIKLLRSGKPEGTCSGAGTGGCN